MDVWDPALIQHRVRIIRVGVLTTFVVLAAFIAFRVLPGGEVVPTHVFWTLWIAALVAGLAAFVAPWEQLFRSKLGRRILYAWSLVDIVLITALIGWAPEEDPTFFLCFAITTVFFSLLYSRRSQVVLFMVTAVSYSALHLSGQTSIPLRDFVLRIGLLAATAVLASFSSRELMRGVLEAIKHQAQSEREKTLYESLAQAQSDLGEGVSISQLSTQRTTYANDAYCRIFGYTHDEIMSMSYIDLVAPQQQQTMRDLKATREANNATAEVDRDLVGLCKDGSHVVVHVVSKPLTDDLVVSVVRDVTEERRAEQDRREREELFRAVSELTSDFVYSIRVGPKGTQTWEWVTDGFTSITGYDITDPEVSSGAASLVHPDDLAASTAMYRDLLSNRGTVRYELRILTKAGDHRWVEFSSEAVFDDVKKRVIRLFGTAQDVTETKRAERAASERAEVLEAVSELTTDYVYGVRFYPDGHMDWLWVTDGLTRVTGYSSEELERDGWHSLIHPDDRTTANESFAQLFSEPDGALVFDHRIVTKAGSVKHVRTHARAVREGEGGESIRVHGAVQDVTDRLLAEEALRTSERRYRSLFDHLPLGMYVRTFDGTGLDANPACVQMFGYPDRDSFLSTHADDLYVDSTERERFIAAIRSQEEAVLEAEFRRNDGSTFWGLMHARAVRDTAGTPKYFEGAVSDVTEQRAARLSLKQSVALLRSTLESTGDGVLVIALDGSVVTYNQRMIDMWEIPREIIERGDAGDAIAAILPMLSDPEGFVEMMGKFDLEPAAETFDVIELLDGRVFERYSRPHVDESIVGRVVNFRDVTERRALEEQLRQAQKMEAVGRLAGGVAHDFNNLLTAILGYCELLRSAPEISEEIRSDIQEIDSAAQLGADITAQLLDLSRRRVLRPEVLDVNEIVTSMEPMLKRLIGDDIILEVQAAQESCRVEVDRSQIEQVLLNLVVNARDALPEGGDVCISTRLTALSSQDAAKGLRLAPGPHVLLSVTDDGAGIAPDNMDRIFEPFFTTHQGGSTGLGLSTVYGIVSQYNGHIEVQSQPGTGTTFRVYIPAATKEVVPIARRKAAERWLSGTETVLLAEDDDTIRRLCKRNLELHGYKVFEASHGVKALEMSEMIGTEIHLLLTDVVMPGMGGRVLGQQIAEMRPGIRVLYMSGYTGEALARFGELGWNEDFLAKPFRPEALAAKVRELLNREDPHSATL